MAPWDLGPRRASAQRSWTGSGHDAVLEVRNPGRLDGAELFQSQAGADVVEQASAAAEQDRDDVQLDLVDEAFGQVLTDHLGAAADEDVLAAGGPAGLARAPIRSRR